MSNAPAPIHTTTVSIDCDVSRATVHRELREPAGPVYTRSFRRQLAAPDVRVSFFSHISVSYRRRQAERGARKSSIDYINIDYLPSA